MKILHTSDWHLGISFRGRSSSDDQQYFVDRICGIIEEKNIGAVIIAGDIFDRSIAGGETVSFYDRIMTRMAGEMGVKVFCVAGNHDSAERLSQCSELLKKSGLYVAGSLTRDFMMAEADDADVYLIPWFSTEKARAVFPEEAENITNIEDAWAVMTGAVRKTFRPGRKHVLVTHAYVVGAETSVSDKTAEIGTASAVGSFVFDGFDYVALGHIHKPQSISDTICYCGSPMPYSFGKEETQEKGVVIIDTKDMSREFVPLGLLRKRTTIRGTYDEILSAGFPEDVRTGYVRLEVTDSFAGAAAMALFSEKYPLILEMKGKDPETEGSGTSITMEDLDEIAKDPAELFKRYCDDSGQDLSEERLKNFRKALLDYEKEAE